MASVIAIGNSCTVTVTFFDAANNPIATHEMTTSAPAAVTGSVDITGEYKPPIIPPPSQAVNITVLRRYRASGRYRWLPPAPDLDPLTDHHPAHGEPS